MAEQAEDERWEQTALEALLDIALFFHKYTELRDALAPVLGVIRMKTGLSWGMVTLVNGQGELAVAEAEGLTTAEKAAAVYRMGEGLAGWVFETGRPLVVPDLALDRRFLNRAPNRTDADLAGKTYYGVPICTGGAVIGTLSAERASPTEAAQTRDRLFLEKAASIIADAAHLRTLLQAQMRAQLLTGLQTGTDTAGERPALSAVHQKPAADTEEETQEPRIPGVIEMGSRIIGTSNAMRDVWTLITQVAPADATVLISGESGTGKELIAAEIQRLSRRAGGPFIKLNCAALPESIIESELFGHERGAFTGALSKRVGKFEAAHRGTLFLDEVGELSPQIQVKLLRVLQEREIERVGGSGTVKVDVRLLAATNKDLAAEAAAGRFREDLFYRLNVFPLIAPPLRDRKGDIMLLADYFTEKYAQRAGKPVMRISSPAIDLLASYHWPGNVRELENCIERAVILTADMVIHAYHLPPSLQSARSTHTEPGATLEPALSRLEKELLVEALKMTRGDVGAAADRLGITESRLDQRLKHYGIRAQSYGNID